MVLDHIHGIKVMYIEVNTKKVREMGLDKWGGWMDLYILGNGRMVFRMVLEEYGFQMD